jgi:NDP-sugar pyrophosphorylase family protein
VRIAAILSLSEDLQNASGGRGYASGLSENASYLRFDVVGQSLLDRAIAKLKQFGVSRYTVISENSQQFLPSRVATVDAFVEAWEQAVANYIEEGVDLLLFFRVNAYSDLDYVQFLRFHLETESPITQAYAADGALDTALVDAARLREVDGAYRRALSTLISRQGRFMYHGYINRLTRPQDFYKLVDDGLHGQCGLRPIGTETRELVWQGAGSEIDDSAAITGPAFIGAGTSIGACCTVGAGSSIERECEVDCGTVVEESWITPNTYLGVALDVRRSIVGQSTLFHLDRNVEVEVADHHLIGAAAKSAPIFAGLGSLLWGECQAAN